MLTTIIRDRSDNMWIGTLNGLFKHEGSRIRAFNRFGKGPAEISGGEMHTLFQDKRGFIWVGTTNGLDKIDPVTYVVKHYPLRSTDSNSSFVGYIYSVFQDRDENIWASTDAAIFRMNYHTGQYATVPVTKDKHGLPSPYASYKSGINTPTGLWIHTYEGPAFYEYATGLFYHRWHNPQKKDIFRMGDFGKGNQSDLRIDKKSNLWFLSNDRNLIRYNLTTEKLDSFRFVMLPGTWPCCYSIAIDARDNVWLGFRQGGVHVFDQLTEKFTVLTTSSAPSLVKSNYVYSLEEDYQGRMWVSTDNGLDIIDLYNTATQRNLLSDRPDFTNLKYEMGTPTTDGKNFIYVPFYRYGFLQANLLKDTVRHFQLEPTGPAGSSYIIPKDSGLVWAARNRKLLPFDLKKGVVSLTTETPPIPPLPDSLRGDFIWHYRTGSLLLYKTNRGRIVCLHNNGTAEVWKGYGFKKNLSLSPDKKTFWYLNDDLNLIRFDLLTHQSSFINLQQKLKPLDFSFANPRDLIDDGECIWMSGQNGLLRYWHTKDSLAFYTPDHGLTHNFTYSVCLDKRNRLYVASLGGIDVYNREANVFENLVSYPTASYVDAFGAGLLMEDGTLQFVLGNKLIRVNPDEVAKGSVQPVYKLQLQEVRLNDEAVHWTAKGLPELKHNQNRFLFRFGLLDFIKQSGGRYFYYLEGLEKDWIENSLPGEVSYNALAPGEYVFHVQCRDASGRKMGKDVRFPLRILPPFWQTWWFRSLMLLLIAFALYRIYKQRTGKIKKEAAIKQQLTELESKALRAQMNPHFIFNSLNAIQELVLTENVTAAYDYLSKFSKLLRLVLNNSEKPLIPLSGETAMLQLYLELESLRFRQSFSFSITVGEALDAETVLVPPLLVQPFIENALWHGLMLKEGEKRLSVRIEAKDSGLMCTVEDNGIGRKRAVEIKEQKLGAGHFESKGLTLSRQRIELLKASGRKGEVKIEDLYEEGHAAGTRVSLYLPLKQS